MVRYGAILVCRRLFDDTSSDAGSAGKSGQLLFRSLEHGYLLSNQNTVNC